MVQYDPKIISHFANRLYLQANLTLIAYPIGGACIGGFGGSLVDHTIKSDSFETGGIGLPIGLLVFGIIGFVVGSGKAFSLRLQAQMALCQMKIEENTRRQKNEEA